MVDLILITEAEQIPAVLSADLPFRSKIEAIEAYFSTLPQVKTEPVHRFAEGLYCRELFMPKGVFWISQVHKKENIGIVSQGDISIYTETGVQRITAPFTVITKPGTKRLAYTHEDTIWTTVHATELTEADGIDRIEAALACGTLNDYDEQLAQEGLCLSHL